MNELPHRILIVGLGLMGGSYAEALTKKGHEIHAITLEQSDIEYALSKGIIARGTTTVDPSELKSFSLIVFALYPEILLDWIGKHAGDFAPGTILTDVTGIKGPIIEPIQKALEGTGVEFVFAHPMAGRESKGVVREDASIFEKANFILTPTEANHEESLALIETLGRELGCKRIARLSPDEHDEMIGYLSQLTHAIAVSLMNAKDNAHLAEYTGDSFRDLTRIADINAEMWTSLFLLNKDVLLNQIDLFQSELSSLRDAIESGDSDKIVEKMNESSKRREAFRKDE